MIDARSDVNLKKNSKSSADTSAGNSGDLDSLAPPSTGPREMLALLVAVGSLPSLLLVAAGSTSGRRYRVGRPSDETKKIYIEKH